jgi:hypothetical protein
VSRRGGSPSSTRWPFLHHHSERCAGSSSSTKVVIYFFTVGVSSHLCQAGPSHLLRHLLGHRPLGHLHRWYHHVQVSSPCSGTALSLSHHSSPSSSTARGTVCHGTLTAAHSSSSRRTSRSGRPCRSTRRLQSQAAAATAPVSSEMEVVLGGGKEYATVEVARPHCSRQSRCSHCSCHRGGPTALTARRSRRSHCSTEARGGLRGGPRRSGNDV